MLSTSPVNASYTPQTNQLNPEQRSMLNQILSRFDLNNMTNQDRNALKGALIQANIPPSQEIMHILSRSRQSSNNSMEQQTGQRQPSVLNRELLHQVEHGEVAPESLPERRGTLLNISA
jgi:hypothetical protein